MYCCIYIYSFQTFNFGFVDILVKINFKPTETSCELAYNSKIKTVAFPNAAAKSVAKTKYFVQLCQKMGLFLSDSGYPDDPKQTIYGRFLTLEFFESAQMQRQSILREIGLRAGNACTIARNVAKSN